MGNKTTYILGAGASFGVLPLVEELPDSLLQFSVSLRNEVKKKPIRTVDDFFCFRGKKINKEEAFIKVSNDAAELAKEIKLLSSFDTLAKRLTIREEFDRLREIKSLLTSFFLYKQRTSNISPRHDAYIASILGTSSTLPNNINILSWNYDSQLEIAYSGYIRSNDDILSVSRTALGLKIPNGDNYDWDGFNLIKINGTAEYGQNKLGDFNVLHHSEDEHEFFEDCVLNYFESIKNKSVHSNIKFSWDSPQYSEFIDNICSAIQDTGSLVVIGYSFPYFNKAVDEKLLGSMKFLSDIYVQDPYSKSIIEIIDSLGVIRTNKTFHEISNLKQFYIPPGT